MVEFVEAFYLMKTKHIRIDLKTYKNVMKLKKKFEEERRIEIIKGFRNARKKGFRVSKDR